MNDSFARRPPVGAIQIGIVAARALGEGARGIVRSAFERSAYVTLGDAWLCLGPTSLGAGPLNVLCEPWPAGALNEGTQVRLVRNALCLGGAWVTSLADAPVWKPRSPPAFSPEDLKRGLSALDATLPGSLPREGLATLARQRSTPRPQDEETKVIVVTRPAAEWLRRFVRGESVSDFSKIEQLPLAKVLGLGPGLTPSGDDFIGGALVALTLLGRKRKRDALWMALTPNLARTTDISRAHLAAAAEGFGNAALHGLLDALLTGEGPKIPARLAAVAAIGHTSGWDALAGAVCVLRAAAELPA